MIDFSGWRDKIANANRKDGPDEIDLKFKYGFKSTFIALAVMRLAGVRILHRHYSRAAGKEIVIEAFPRSLLDQEAGAMGTDYCRGLYLNPLDIPVLEGLPEDKQEAMKTLGLWPDDIAKDWT